MTDTNRTENQNFYRVVSEPGETCPCGHGTQWTIVHLEGDEEIGISTSWQGPEGKELAEDICDLMNMAYDAGQESRQETIKGLCDRLNRIHTAAVRGLQQGLPGAALRTAEEWSAGFMEMPT